MILSSESLNNLNIVKIQYTQGAEVGQLFESSTSPLYLVDSTLPQIKFHNDTVNVWSAGHNIMGKLGAAGNALGSIDAFRSIAGDWAKFSGCIDMRSKFLFAGSEAQSFTMHCMLVNRYGWDVSIAPELNKLAEWLLPSRVSDGKGGFVKLTSSLTQELKTANDKAANKVQAFEGLLGFLNEGIDGLGKWMGDVFFLNMPQQFDDMRQDRTVQIIVGKYKFNEVYIKSVSISTPRAFMQNENKGIEPDHVIIEFVVEGLRQTSTANKPF